MDSNPSTMGPTLKTETDFLTIVTFIKAELSRIMTSASSVDSIKTYISNLVKYIEATEQSTDLEFSDSEEKDENAGDGKKKLLAAAAASAMTASAAKAVALAADAVIADAVVADAVIDAAIVKKERSPEVPAETVEKPDIVKQSLAGLNIVPEDDEDTMEEIADVPVINTEDDNIVKVEVGDEMENADTENADAGDVDDDATDIEAPDTEETKEDKVINELACPGCQKVFETKELLHAHFKVNPGRKRFKCSGCCKAFKHKVSLRLHKVEENHGIEVSELADFEKFLSKLFVCEICNKRHLGQSNLDRHMLMHTGGKPYQCNVCMKQFKQKRSLLQHSEREEHYQDSLPQAMKNASRKRGAKRDPLYRCKHCDRIYTTQNQLNSHMKVHAKGAAYGCNSCGRYFTRKETLEKHLARDCSGDVFPVAVKCGMCEEKFTKKSQLDMHLATHLDNVSTKAGSQNNMDSFMHNAETGDYGNEEISALANQIAAGIMGDPETVNGTGSSEAPNPPVKRGRGRRPGARRPPYQCEYCPKIFNRRKEWRNHQYLHTGEKPHVCEICGKTFRLRQVCTLHIATHGGNKFKCNICDKTYPYKNQLVRHSYTHSGIKPYKCEQCGKGFISKPELNRHYGVHGGGKTYVCDICGKSCRNIKKHTLACHTEREKVRCEICQKEYVSKSKLKVHMQTHTTTKAFICPICGKGFAMNKYLSKHMILSHGEKKHKCQVCGKSFAFSQQLKMHERTHTVENPYPPQPYYPTYPIGPTFW